MLNCKELVKMVSSEEPKTWKRHIGVRFHLLMCQHCSRYVKQLDMVKAGIRNLIQTKASQSNKKRINDIEESVLKKVK